MCVGLGIFYEPLYRLLPYAVDFQPYTGAHVVSQLQLLLFSGLAFFVMLKWLQRTLTITLDTDWFYRVFLAAAARNIEVAMSAVRDWMAARIRRGGARAWTAVRRLHDPDGILARTWQSGTMAMLMLIMLVTLLVIGYLE